MQANSTRPEESPARKLCMHGRIDLDSCLYKHKRGRTKPGRAAAASGKKRRTASPGCCAHTHMREEKKDSAARLPLPGEKTTERRQAAPEATAAHEEDSRAPLLGCRCIHHDVAGCCSPIHTRRRREKHLQLFSSLLKSSPIAILKMRFLYLAAAPQMKCRSQACPI
jgi:hypothetical protein